jgi:hypothetical protein
MPSILADLVYEAKRGGGGGWGVMGSQPKSTAVRRSPKKLWRSNSIFNEFWIYSVYGKFYLKPVRGASLSVQKIREYFHLFILQVFALRKSAQSCLQLASLAQ